MAWNVAEPEEEAEPCEGWSAPIRVVGKAHAEGLGSKRRGWTAPAVGAGRGWKHAGRRFKRRWRREMAWNVAEPEEEAEPCEGWSAPIRVVGKAHAEGLGSKRRGWTAPTVGAGGSWKHTGRRFKRRWRREMAWNVAGPEEEAEPCEGWSAPIRVMGKAHAEGLGSKRRGWAAPTVGAGGSWKHTGRRETVSVAVSVAVSTSAAVKTTPPWAFHGPGCFGAHTALGIVLCAWVA